MQEYIVEPEKNIVIENTVGTRLQRLWWFVAGCSNGTMSISTAAPIFRIQPQHRILEFKYVRVVQSHIRFTSRHILLFAQ